MMPDNELHTQIQYRLIEQLSESERRYRELVENLYEVVFETNAEYCLTFLNSAWTEHLGYGVTESLGRQLDEFIDTEELLEFRWQSLTSVDVPIKGREVRFRHRQSHVVWFELSARFQSGKGIVGSLVNITDRKLTAIALQQSEIQYRSVVDNLKEVIFQTDGNGLWTFLNPAWTEITQFSLEESLGKLFLAFVYPNDRQKDLERFQALMAGQQTCYHYEIRYLTKSGEVRWFEVFVCLMLDAQGQIEGTSGTLNDVTEKKHSREALEQQVSQEQVLSAIAQRIRQSLHLDEILYTAVTEIRQLLQTDRVLIYHLKPDWSGQVIVESVESHWITLRDRVIVDECFATDACILPYTQGRIRAVADIYKAELPECYVDMLAQFQVRANLVVPIIKAKMLWGLLIVHQCSGPRPWQPWEIDLLRRLSIQVGIAIQQSQLYEQLQTELQQREQAFRELKQVEEKLQVSLHEKEVLLKEIHHRVKNNLLVVASLLDLQSEHLEDDAIIKVFENSQHRIQSMALIHEKLYQSKHLDRIDLSEYLQTLVDQLILSLEDYRNIQIHYKLQSISVNIETAIPCGLIVNELVCNIFEHAFPNRQEGNIELTVEQSNNAQITIIIRDDGVGLPTAIDFRSTESLGLQLVCLLTKQLDGHIHLHMEQGTAFQLQFFELQYHRRI